MGHLQPRSVDCLRPEEQRLVSAGKGEKMEAVYDYVTSAQFAQKVHS